MTRKQLPYSGWVHVKARFDSRTIHLFLFISENSKKANMQVEGTVKFLKFHQAQVKGVAFSPTDRYLFCSGGYDGKVNLYTALRTELLMSYQITSMTVVKNINAVRFTIDGSKILAATTARRLAVVDVERGEQLLAYDNCAFNGRDRVGVAADPICPSLATCVGVNGKGLTILDLRLPLPVEFFYEMHDSTIRDVTFLHPSWPWSIPGHSTIATAGSDGTVKISAANGLLLHSFSTNQKNLNAICATPELYNRCADDGFRSLLICGGDEINSYVPDVGIRKEVLHDYDYDNSSVWKLKYTSNGSLLYAACEDGKLRRYRRYPDHHEYLGEVYTHKGDIQDLDISPYDEYLVTASRDKTVGILRLGAPNHGWTNYSELT